MYFVPSSVPRGPATRSHRRDWLHIHVHRHSHTYTYTYTYTNTNTYTNTYTNRYTYTCIPHTYAACPEGTDYKKSQALLGSNGCEPVKAFLFKDWVLAGSSHGYTSVKRGLF